jgi:hypothetical protein
MHARTKLHLSAADRTTLEAVVTNRNSPQKHVWRAKIVLLTADGHGTNEIMQRTGKAKTVIWRWQERFGSEGATGLWRDKTRPSRIPPLDPAIAERVLSRTLAGPPAAATLDRTGHGQSDRDQRQLGSAHLARPRSAAASRSPVQTVQRSEVCRQTA